MRAFRLKTLSIAELWEVIIFNGSELSVYGLWVGQNLMVWSHGGGIRREANNGLPWITVPIVEKADNAFGSLYLSVCCGQLWVWHMWWVVPTNKIHRIALEHPFGFQSTVWSFVRYTVSKCLIFQPNQTLSRRPGPATSNYGGNYPPLFYVENTKISVYVESPPNFNFFFWEFTLALKLSVAPPVYLWVTATPYGSNQPHVLTAWLHTSDRQISKENVSHSHW